jgi:ABC-type transport system involved in cytochrome c biogenesis permease component
LGTDAPWKNFTATDSWLIRVILLASGLTALGALGGIVALWRKGAARELALPLAVYPLAFPLLYYVTHAQLRLRHPIDPVVMVLTALAIAGVTERLRKSGRKQEPLAAG